VLGLDVVEAVVIGIVEAVAGAVVPCTKPAATMAKDPAD